MPSIGSATRTIRFNASDLGIIEDVMQKENTSFNNAVHLLIENGVHPKISEKSSSGTPEKEEKMEKQGTPDADLGQIEEMASLMRVDTGKIISDIKAMLENGELYYSGSRLVNPRYEEFENICAAKKQDPDRMIANVVRQMGG